MIRAADDMAGWEGMNSLCGWGCADRLQVVGVLGLLTAFGTKKLERCRKMSNFLRITYWKELKQQEAFEKSPWFGSFYRLLWRDHDIFREATAQTLSGSTFKSLYKIEWHPAWRFLWNFLDLKNVFATFKSSTITEKFCLYWTGENY